MNMYNFDANWRIANLDETKTKLCSPQLCLKQLVGAGRVAVGTLRCGPQGLDHAACSGNIRPLIYTQRKQFCLWVVRLFVRVMSYVVCTMYGAKCIMYYAKCMMHYVFLVYYVFCIMYYALLCVVFVYIYVCVYKNL